MTAALVCQGFAAAADSAVSFSGTADINSRLSNADDTRVLLEETRTFSFAEAGNFEVAEDFTIDRTFRGQTFRPVLAGVSADATTSVDGRETRGTFSAGGGYDAFPRLGDSSELLAARGEAYFTGFFALERHTTLTLEYQLIGDLTSFNINVGGPGHFTGREVIAVATDENNLRINGSEVGALSAGTYGLQFFVQAKPTPEETGREANLLNLNYSFMFSDPIEGEPLAATGDPGAVDAGTDGGGEEPGVAIPTPTAALGGLSLLALVGLRRRHALLGE